MIRILFTVLVLTVGATGISTAQDAFFDDGNQRYQAGDFAGALERYERILEEGFESGEVYYNIGNSYFKLGELGPAILFYERARRLLPGDADVQANLELARSLTVDEITPLPGFWLFRAARWWVDLLPRSSLRGLLTLGYVLTMAAVALTILRPSPFVTRWSRRIAGTGVVVIIVFGLNLLVRELGLGVSAQGVILVDEATVQSAPSDDTSLELFTVHEGTTVRLDRRSDVWVEIVLADGQVGWVRADQLEEI